MSNGLIIILIIVVWLFVLAPLLMRGQKSIRRAGEGFDDTRVIHEGGSGDLPARRRPRLTAADVRPTPETTVEEEDLELVGADEVLIDDDLTRPSRSFRGLFTRQTGEEADAGPGTDTGLDAEQEIEVVDGDIVHELEAGPRVEADEEDSTVVVAAVEEPEDEWDEETTYAYDDSYTSPGDLMYPDSVDSVVEVLDTDEHEDATRTGEADEIGDADMLEDLDDLDGDLSEEDIEFAEHRAGRGGWDPVADAEYSLTRYQRRQRTLIGLGTAVVLTAILAFLLGGWAWALAGVTVAVSGAYLMALRTQVREEQALRARRIRQLRRARLGVLNAADEELAIPRHLRHPGAVVLERDDESPDFDHLPLGELHLHEEPSPEPRGFRRPDRFHDDRRVG
ncbi:gephyrin-like molybdotransferase receptor GlpR [Corynebacterium sp.]|uniref:divisome protein SepX/GlpR n=1 Tax=Corynebacterium sp. TaxID=1720 RepID=UPI0025BA974C|nr:gephyrin-like molybdotransferase receptor GlpR [Corynebacterium sp.]